MKKIILLIIIFLYLIFVANVQANENITSDPNISQDLGIAQTYWRETDPSAQTFCASVQIVVAPMVSTEVEGVVFPASDIWAETPLNGCQISLSPPYWASITTISASIQVMPSSGIVVTPWTILCFVIVHEYGHIIGLDDTFKTSGVMNPYAPANSVPACNSAQQVFTPAQAQQIAKEEAHANEKLKEREEVEKLSGKIAHREELRAQARKHATRRHLRKCHHHLRHCSKYKRR